MKYDVQIANVREVSLWGTADLDYWAERLRPFGLHPTVADGRAVMLVVACAARFKGVPFRELSISVSVSRHEGGAGRDGAYLLHAWNSIRFFAFVERAMFKTPYYHGGINVEPGPPALARLTEGGATTYVAEMANASRRPSRDGDECWEGPVFLPGCGGSADGGRLFHAKLIGPTRAYPFAAGTDVLKLDTERGSPAIGQLAASRFAGLEWVVRDSATHGKTKTIVRGESW